MPILLDLYCGAGGAAVGYHRAGFDVMGVDIDPQPDYPFPFCQYDALQFLASQDLSGYDVIHASPPCQTHTPVSRYSVRVRRRELVDLLPETRARLVASGRPYVIENVIQAPLHHPTILCGATFGLNIYRHRAFESSLPLTAPPHTRHTRLAMRNGYLPTPDRPVMTITGRNGHHSKEWRRVAAQTMGTPWITELNQVCEAIPPAYTHHIGTQLLERINHAHHL